MIRSSKWFIVEKCLKSVWESVFVCISFIFLFDLSIGAALLLYLFIILAASPIINSIRWYFTTLQIDESNVHFRKGVLFRKHITLPRERITNVTIQQSILQRIGHCYEVMLDTGAQDEGHSQIKLLLNHLKALGLKEQLNEQHPEEQQPIFRLSKYDLFKFGFLKNSIISTVALVVSFYFFADEIASFFSYDLNRTVQGAGMFLWNHPLYIVPSLLSFYVLGKLVTVIRTYIKYYDFHIKEDDEVFTIEHGYFAKRVYTISKAHLYGIKREQRLAFQLCNVYAIHCCVVGQNQEEAKERIFVPIATEKQADLFIETYFPQYAFREAQISVKREHRLYFLFMPFLIATIATILLAIINPFFLLLFLSYPFLFVHFFLEGKQTAFGCVTELLWMRKGGLIQKEYCVERKSLQAYREGKTYFQKQAQIGTYLLAFWSNHITLRHVSEEIWKKL